MRSNNTLVVKTQMVSEECQSDETIIAIDAKFSQYRIDVALKEEAFRREIEDLKRKLS
jgi:hypothetical protein